MCWAKEIVQEINYFIKMVHLHGSNSPGPMLSTRTTMASSNFYFQKCFLSEIVCYKNWFAFPASRTVLRKYWRLWNWVFQEVSPRAVNKRSSTKEIRNLTLHLWGSRMLLKPRWHGMKMTAQGLCLYIRWVSCDPCSSPPQIFSIKCHKPFRILFLQK